MLVTDGETRATNALHGAAARPRGECLDALAAHPATGRSSSPSTGRHAPDARTAGDSAFDHRRVSLPVISGIRKWLCRHISQTCCPWNVRFSKELVDDSPYAPREALAGKDARTLARELLVMTQEEFGRAYSKSPMKRAKLRGLKRNAAVVLGNIGTLDDAELLARVRDEEPDEMVREHAVWAISRLSTDRR